MGMTRRKAARELTDEIAKSDASLRNNVSAKGSMTELFHNSFGELPYRARYHCENLIDHLEWDKEGEHKGTITDMRWAVQRITETGSVEAILEEYRSDRRAAFGGEGAPEFT